MEEIAYRVVQVAPVAGGEAFLLLSGAEAALIDTGYGFCCEQLTENIRKNLSESRLKYVILTHSHYDHISATAAVKTAFPEAVVVASERTAEILKRPNALKKMIELNQKAAERNGCSATGCESVAEIRVDKTVGEGDKLTVGTLEFTVYMTPGHTKCSMVLFCEREGLLISSETLGIPMGGELVKPGYVVGYKMTIASIQKIQRLPVRRILFPHDGLADETFSRGFLERALFWNEEIRRRVIVGYRNGKTEEELVDEFKQLYFYADLSRLQIEEAFLLNARHMVSMLIKEYEAEGKC